MEQLYRDFTVCKKCSGTCYIGNDYCEDCANEMWQKLKEFAKWKMDYFNKYEDDFGVVYELVLDKMQELEKEKVKNE